MLSLRMLELPRFTVPEASDLVRYMHFTRPFHRVTRAWREEYETCLLSKNASSQWRSSDRHESRIMFPACWQAASLPFASYCTSTTRSSSHHLISQLQAELRRTYTYSARQYSTACVQGVATRAVKLPCAHQALSSIKRTAGGDLSTLCFAWAVHCTQDDALQAFGRGEEFRCSLKGCSACITLH